MIPYYIFAWIASTSAALTILTSKFTSKYAIKNPWLFNFLWMFVVLLFTIPSSLANHAGLPHAWGFIFLASLFAVLWNIFFILSLYRLDVSTLSPLFNFRSVFAVILGVILFNEHLSSQQFVFFIAIFIAGIFATIDEKFDLRVFFRSSTLIGILAMLFLAINNVLIKFVMAQNDVWTGNLWMSIITFLMLIPTIPLFRKELTKIRFKQILPVGGMGILQTITNVTANIAYGVNVGITSLIMAVPVSFILVFFLSLFVPSLLEKHTIKVYVVRFSAALVMIYFAVRLTS